jgi:hypothetical protein
MRRMTIGLVRPRRVTADRVRHRRIMALLRIAELGCPQPAHPGAGRPLGADRCTRMIRSPPRTSLIVDTPVVFRPPSSDSMRKGARPGIRAQFGFAVKGRPEAPGLTQEEFAGRAEAGTVARLSRKLKAA